MTHDEAVHATNDALMEAVGKVLDIADQGDSVPMGAILIYRMIEADGEPVCNYVVTQDMALGETIGLAHWVREEAVGQMLNPDYE